jgi:hypothetical protein
VTTLRNRNPNRNHLFGWSAEASSVENICGGALKLRAILKFDLSILWSHRGERRLWASLPSQKSFWQLMTWPSIRACPGRHTKILSVVDTVRERPTDRALLLKEIDAIGGR